MGVLSKKDDIGFRAFKKVKEIVLPDFMKFSESGLAKGKESFYTELQKAGFLDLTEEEENKVLEEFKENKTDLEFIEKHNLNPHKYENINDSFNNIKISDIVKNFIRTNPEYLKAYDKALNEKYMNNIEKNGFTHEYGISSLFNDKNVGELITILGILKNNPNAITSDILDHFEKVYLNNNKINHTNLFNFLYRKSLSLKDNEIFDIIDDINIGNDLNNPLKASIKKIESKIISDPILLEKYNNFLQFLNILNKNFEEKNSEINKKIISIIENMIVDFKSITEDDIENTGFEGAFDQLKELKDLAINNKFDDFLNKINEIINNSPSEIYNALYVLQNNFIKDLEELYLEKNSIRELLISLNNFNSDVSNIDLQNVPEELRGK